MPIVGALARLEIDEFDETCSRINELSGFTTFEVAEEGAVGVLIEADTLRDAHELIAKSLPQVPGVMGAWPIYIGLDEEGSHADPADLPVHACSPQGER